MPESDAPPCRGGAPSLSSSTSFSRSTSTPDASVHSRPPRGASPCRRSSSDTPPSTSRPPCTVSVANVPADAHAPLLGRVDLCRRGPDASVGRSRLTSPPEGPRQRCREPVAGRARSRIQSSTWRIARRSSRVSRVHSPTTDRLLPAGHAHRIPATPMQSTQAEPTARCAGTSESSVWLPRRQAV